jgi:hypothetical protein
MDNRQLGEICECISLHDRLFHYFKDRYALMLLSYVMGDRKSLRELRESNFGRLLDKPVLRNIVRRLPDGRLTRAALDTAWPASIEAFHLSLGSWGNSGHNHVSYYQTSRAGKNLVLRLDFSAKHNRQYHRLLEPSGGHPFELHSHPISGDGAHTMAWARIDVDLEAGEALIEEIQNDWIRMAIRDRNAMAAWTDEQREGSAYHRNGSSYRVRQLDLYIETVLRPYIDIWDEAMLAAAIWFLREELGIRRIFYHTFESGIELKRIAGPSPPRSLYTSLPRRFCFREVNQKPAFLANLSLKPPAGNVRRMKPKRRKLLEAEREQVRLQLLEL